MSNGNLSLLIEIIQKKIDNSKGVKKLVWYSAKNLISIATYGSIEDLKKILEEESQK